MRRDKVCVLLHFTLTQPNAVLDLVKASKSEPANTAVQEELKRVDSLLEKKKAKVSIQETHP